PRSAATRAHGTHTNSSRTRGTDGGNGTNGRANTPRSSAPSRARTARTIVSQPSPPRPRRRSATPMNSQPAPSRASPLGGTGRVEPCAHVQFQGRSGLAEVAPDAQPRGVAVGVAPGQGVRVAADHRGTLPARPRALPVPPEVHPVGGCDPVARTAEGVVDE